MPMLSCVLAWQGIDQRDPTTSFQGKVPQSDLHHWLRFSWISRPTSKRGLKYIATTRSTPRSSCWLPVHHWVQSASCHGLGAGVSDVELVRRSGFLSSSRHYHSDQILADWGFTLQDDFATMTGSQLIIPAFTKGKLQLGGHEVEASRKMSSVRIHVERVIGLLKNRYTILQGTIPIQLLKSQTNEASDETTISSIDKIVTVCAALINLGEGIVVKWVNKGYIQKISHTGEGKTIILPCNLYSLLLFESANFAIPGSSTNRPNESRSEELMG